MAGFLLRILLAARTHGTNDVDTWIAFIHAIAERGPLAIYGIESWPGVPFFRFNHGPLVAWTLALTGWIGAALGIGWPFLVRLPASLADFASTFLVWKLVRQQRPAGAAAAAATLVALNPALILISGFHGNTDTVFLALLLALLLAVQQGRPAWAGLAYGLALGVKVVPVLLLPAVGLAFAGWKDRRTVALAAALTSLLIWSPHLARSFWPVVHQVFLYQGNPNVWGLSLLYAVVRREGVPPALSSLASWGTVALVWTSSAWSMRSARTSGSRARTVSAAFLLFLALTPGFGVQYLAWPVPFLVIAAPWLAFAYSAVIGLFLYATYAHWCGSWWLDHANSWTTYPDWTLRGQALKATCWVLVVFIGSRLHTSMARGPQAIAGDQRPA